MKIGIIGATHAGVYAAKQIKSEHPEAEVTVFEKILLFHFCRAA